MVGAKTTNLTLFGTSSKPLDSSVQEAFLFACSYLLRFGFESLDLALEGIKLCF